VKKKFGISILIISLAVFCISGCLNVKNGYLITSTNPKDIAVSAGIIGAAIGYMAQTRKHTKIPQSSIPEISNSPEGQETYTDTSPPAFNGVQMVVNLPKNGIRLYYDKAFDDSLPITYYIFYRKNGEIKNFDIKAAKQSTGTTSIDIMNLEENVKYYFAVKAVDTFGNTDSNKKQKSLIVIKKYVPNLKITRVHYLGVLSNEPDEYVEIKNQSYNNVNLKGFILRDWAGNTFTFPDYTLKNGYSVRVYTNQFTTNDSFTGDIFSFQSRYPIWSNKSDRAFLIDESDVLIDEYEYEASY